MKAYPMEFNQLIPQVRAVPGAVTVADALDRLSPGTPVFVFLTAAKNLILVEGTVLFIQRHEVDGQPDVKLTVAFNVNDKPRTSTLLLGESYNGHSNLAGDEPAGNFNRVFTNRAEGLQYFETVQFVHDTIALERSGDIRSLITRLIKAAPPPDDRLQ